jgi:hypothetical protein
MLTIEAEHLSYKRHEDYIHSQGYDNVHAQVYARGAVPLGSHGVASVRNASSRFFEAARDAKCSRAF